MPISRVAYGAIQGRTSLAGWQRLGRFFFATQEPNTEYEHGKMVDEGGGSVATYTEAKEELKSKSKLGKVVEGVKHQVEVEKKTAKEMMNDLKEVPANTQETVQELKETAAVAGEAIKRDAGKIAEKVGLK